MKLENNLYSIYYALIPIIIISFFLLDSLINKHVRGYIFLVGLAFSLITSFMIGNTFDFDSVKNPNELCIPFTINNMSTYSNLPLNSTILFYTATNLLYTALLNNFVLQNFAFIMFIILLTSVDFYWVISNKCYSVQQVIAGSLIGLWVAVLWSFILHKSNNKYFVYNIGVDNTTLCEIPKKKTYKCKTKL